MDTNGRILVVDDEANVRLPLVELLREEGYSVEAAADGFKALGKLPELAPHLVLADLEMPGMDGIELLGKIHEHDADIGVLVMTAFGAAETAVAAMGAGACAYLTKPVNAAELSLVVKRELAQQRLRREAGALRARLAERYRFENLIGGSAPMQAVFKTVAQVAAARACVLLTGEPGTGKELIAAAIHEKSARARAPFVKLHCASLAESILDGELCGHERGAGAGAGADAGARRDGRLFEAQGGTLFLDEIGAISPALQGKLLRFLKEHQFERVGGNETLSVDVRIVAASNRDLRQLVADGKFREDLFDRLNVINIEMPALRDRPSDVPLLAMHFLRKYAGESRKAITGFTEEALERLGRYSWPGNVRELENVVERAVLLGLGPRISGAELPPNLASAQGAAAIQIPGSTLDAIERYAITKTLEATAGSTSRAAEILGISIRKVQYKLHEYQTAPRSEREAVALGVKGN